MRMELVSFIFKNAGLVQFFTAWLFVGAPWLFMRRDIRVMLPDPGDRIKWGPYTFQRLSVAEGLKITVFKTISFYFYKEVSGFFEYDGWEVIRAMPSKRIKVSETLKILILMAGFLFLVIYLRR